MNLNDPVSFVDEPLQGIITRIIDDKTVGVTVQDGFEIPVLKSKLVYAAGFRVQPSASGARPVKSSDAIAAGLDLASGMYLVFELRFGSYFYVKCMNHLPYRMLLTVHKLAGNQHTLVYAADMKPGDMPVLDNLDLAEGTDWPLFVFRGLPCSQGTELPQVFHSRYSYRGVDFTKPLKADGKTMHAIRLKQTANSVPADSTYPLPDPLAAIRRSMAEARPVPEKQVMERPSEIIDLHIDKLTETAAAMPADEALALQLRHFDNCFEKGLSLNYDKMTFIHGVGNGTLKYEIRKRLSSSKLIKSFRDAHKEQFGYGATEVFFK